MTDFKTYYSSKFRQDINQFFSTIPDDSRFHEDKDNKQIFSIQHERLTPSKNHLDFLDKDEKEYFGVALFFTVLTDMVCYTYYKDKYEKFQRLTRYPKLIGNCLSWCHYHLHPRDIFYAMNQGRKPSEPQLLFIDKFFDAIETMKIETIEFFNKHLSEINGEIFWENCQREFPFVNNHIETKGKQ
ncbi:MAG: hypothetical protein COZ16_02715 [Flavobacteriaceae bacterium CG_4_10_14_3_um_filter_31_253]|nr:MAG: hypothetical protein COW43_05345 [Flavobacteriaceae bacterium CG17_big_fil_post_rev_8_21_14_2_50_31_13]PIX11615.1 MAG: hypothetical protein COZ74_13605 [Flavobacteriaceae bacterium CG_4_8_14_3_um_filter_31_8]PIY15802.1 MAG: hypothetical protein COZ16_02715 [Flavobacteriaceae bacterium CG_4_10_14_3_um_filter_31_253]PIZ10512.1 MAG: hypothetical protein COY55_08290 [Flavobacteriaceae bacterium CG_4_10_14_0_8_um_filter_31_99]PJC08717.1 MAG: hypothetical protein CO067_13520 [Flavobacteriacea